MRERKKSSQLKLEQIRDRAALEKQNLLKIKFRIFIADKGETKFKWTKSISKDKYKNVFFWKVILVHILKKRKMFCLSLVLQIRSLHIK